MQSPIETIPTDYGSVKIFQDEDPSNPRTEFDNAGTMVCFHCRYNLGDKTDLRSDQFSSWDDLKDYLYREQKAAVVLPIFMYDHSGLTIATHPFSCPWDSGQIGFIYISREDAIREWGRKYLTQKVIQKVTACLESEVKEYDLFLRGEVYGYVKNDHQDREIDSCWGFFGLDYIRKEVAA